MNVTRQSPGAWIVKASEYSPALSGPWRTRSEAVADAMIRAEQAFKAVGIVVEIRAERASD